MSSKKIVKSLFHLIVAYLSDNRGHMAEHYSNFNDLTHKMMCILNDVKASKSIDFFSEM